jgi:hypothetical protein
MWTFGNLKISGNKKLHAQLLFFSPEMGESPQLNFAPKISGEFLSIWAKFPQISKFFG